MAGIALGLASRPTYDAAEALLRNKQIEYERELRLKQMALQKKLAAQQAMMQGLGMLNQNLQQQASQANQRQMQQEAIQAQMARDAQQQSAQQGSLLERQFNEMNSRWRAGVEAAQKAGFGFDPKHQPAMSQLEDKLLKIDQALVAGDIDPANAIRQKMSVLQQLATFKPNVPMEDPVERALQKLVRVGPDGQRLKPGVPPVPGERQFTIDDKGNLDPVTPLPQPKVPDAAAAQQKLSDARHKAETDLANELIKHTDKLIENSRAAEKLGTGKVLSREEARKEALEDLKPRSEQFERQFGVPSESLRLPLPPGLTQQQQLDLNQAQGMIQQYGQMPPGSNGPEHEQIMDWARRTVQELAPIALQSSDAPPPSAPPVPENLNGQPLSDAGRYMLGPGQAVDETTFPQSPVYSQYIEAAGGNPQRAYEQFNSDRSAIESQVPKINAPSESASLPQGSLFFNDRGELLQNIPNPQPKPRRGPSPRGGGAGGGGRPPQQAPRGGEQKKPPPPGRPQTPQQPLKRGMPLDRILGEGDGKDRRGNTPPRTLVFLKRGDPNNQKFIDDIVAKLTPEQQKQLHVSEVDPTQPDSPDNPIGLAKHADVRAFPNVIRQEWDGKKYVIADRIVSPKSADEMSEFMQNGKNPPPPNGRMAHTYVFLDRADKTGAAERWAKISSQMSEVERANVTVFDSSADQAEKLNIKSFPAVVRGEWNGKTYNLTDEVHGKEAMEKLKDVSSYREFARPQRDRDAENQVDEDIKAAERFDRQFTENMERHGDPLKGMVRSPYEKREGLSQRELRQDAIYRSAYENWRNNAEAFDPSGREIIPKRTPSVLPGPTPAEIEAAKSRNQIGPPTNSINATSKASGTAPPVTGEYDSAKAAIKVYGEMPSSKLSPREKGILDNAYRTVGRYENLVPPSKRGEPISPESWLTAPDEDVLKATKSQLERAQQTIDRLNQKRAGSGVIGQGYKLNDSERSEYDQAKTQQKYSTARIEELLRKQQTNQADFERKRQQDRARREQQRLTAPPEIQPRGTTAPQQQPAPSRPQVNPMQRPMSQVPSLPMPQMSRTQQLKQGLATSVMKPGQLNLDEVNAGLAAMTGPQRVPYTGGILGGMQKPPQQPSNQLGMGVETFNPFGIPNPYNAAGGFIQQPGYMGGYGGYGYGGGGGNSFDMQFLSDAGIGSNYGSQYYDMQFLSDAEIGSDYGSYYSPMIDLPQPNYGLTDQYGGGSGGFDNMYDMNAIPSFGPPGAFSPGPEIISEGYY